MAKQEVRLGTAGIPGSTEGRSSIEGVKEVRRLGLNAMEVEFVRGVKMGDKTAIALGEAAREADVALSIHAPYYINLTSEKKSTLAASKRMILDSASRGELFGARAIAIHSSYYGKLTPEQCFQGTKAAFLDILDKMKEQGIKKVKLAMETMGKAGQFGTIDEVVRMHKATKGKVIPCMDWAHVFVRQGGKIDYPELLRKLKPLKLPYIYSHFEGMKWVEGKKHYQDIHVPLADGPPPFPPLAKEIMRKKLSVHLICESPLLEEDALRMKASLKRAGYKF